MKTAFLLLAIVVSVNTNAYADGCYAYGRSYAAGESDCDGRVCQQDGTWAGVVKSGVCDVTEASDDSGRDPASVGKHKKHKVRKHVKKKKAKATK